MDNTLNYNIKFETNANKITAGVDRLDKALDTAGKGASKMGQRFTGALDKINSKLNTVALDSFINNVQSVSEGLNSLAEPGMKLSTSLADLSAITDVTGKKLKEIEGYARQNAKTFGGDAAAGVESYKLILSQLNPEIANTPKALQEMGKSVSVLSKTMGGDSAAATEVLTTAMNQYQISTEDPIAASQKMSEMMNVMAAAAKEGSAELPQIKEALEQAGMAAKVSGVNFAETNAFIQILDKAGKKGAEGGTALRSVMTSLSQGRFLPPQTTKELVAAGIDINRLADKTIPLRERLMELKPIMNDTALVGKLFGEPYAASAIAMISNIEEADRLTEAIQGTNTAYEQAAIVMDSQAEKNARLKARVDDFKISMFNATGGALGYASVLGQVAFDVANLIPLFSGAMDAISWLTKAKNLDMIATKAKLVWDGVATGATWLWTGAQTALNAVMTANPIGIIIVAIAALAAGIAWVVSKTEGWGEAWKHTVNGAKFLWQMFVATAKAHFNTLINAFMIGINLIKRGWINLQMALGNIEDEEGERRLKKIKNNSAARLESIKEGYKKAAEYALKAKDEFAAAAGSITLKNKTETATANTSTDAGIVAPVAPGTDPDVTGAGGNKTKTTDKTKTNTAIATGGTKHTNVTITFKELIGILNIKGSDFKDSAKQMEEKTTDGLMRVLAMANTAAS